MPRPKSKKPSGKPFREALSEVVAENRKVLKEAAQALFARAVTGAWPP